MSSVRRESGPVASAVAASIDAALALALSDDRDAPPWPAERRLAGLFADLAGQGAQARAREIEALIWALWSNHVDPALDHAMGEAIEALAARRHAQARVMLDRLVDAAPDWAEAWNKRATLAFVEGRDADSLGDIVRTLAREPRHFGALAGLGQICLRHDRPREALAAFDVALRINPHMEGVARTVSSLRKELGQGDLN